jgi:hypothetical protein
MAANVYHLAEIFRESERIWSCGRSVVPSAGGGRTASVQNPIGSLGCSSGSIPERLRGGPGVSSDELRGHTKTIMSIACSSDGRSIVSGSLDGTIKIWSRFEDKYRLASSSSDCRTSYSATTAATVRSVPLRRLRSWHRRLRVALRIYSLYFVARSRSLGRGNWCYLPTRLHGNHWILDGFRTSQRPHRVVEQLFRICGQRVYEPDLTSLFNMVLPQGPEKAELVKLRYFAGLKISEAAEILGISTATADRYWAYARAWLQTEISHEE